MKLKKLIKSYGFWTALAGAVVVLVNAIGKACGFIVDGDIISNIIMAVAGILVVFGVVSMPKNDVKKEEVSSKKQDEGQEKEEE